jgi:hypothetical protein
LVSDPDYVLEIDWYLTPIMCDPDYVTPIIWLFREDPEGRVSALADNLG